MIQTASRSFPDPYHPITDPPPPPKQTCLKGYTPYLSGCYRLLSNNRKSWQEMRDECRSHSTGSIKSDLASIHSSAEDATLHIITMQYEERAWIGFKENEVCICTRSNIVQRTWLHLCQHPNCAYNYRHVCNISRTLAGNKIVDHSDVIVASPVGAAPTTSSFST